jgi:tetratricopeptide (TPR) repeat protein
METTKNPDAYLNYFKANSELLSAMGMRIPDLTGFRSAINYYDKAIGYDPDFANAYARRAIAISWAIHSGEIDAVSCDKSDSDIKAASVIKDDLPDVFIARGFYYYYCIKDYENAEKSFNDPLLKEADKCQSLFYRTMLYRSWGRWDDVRRLLDEMRVCNFHDPLILTNIGLCYDFLHEFDNALSYHQKAIDVKPDWPAAYFNKIGSLLFKYGNTTEARFVLDFLIRNFPDKQVEYNILFDMYNRDYPEAFAKAFRAYPEDFPCKSDRFMYLANISLLLGDKENADMYFGLALVVLNLELGADGSNANIHSLIGLAMAGKGDRQAIDEGKLAVELAKKAKDYVLESEMNINLAEIYTKLGMCEMATQQIDYILNNPSYFSAKMLMLDPVWKPWLECPESKNYITESGKKVLTSK